MAAEMLLVDAIAGGEILSTSERAFYELLRKNPDLASKARVVLGPRCVRYKVSALRDWIENLPEAKPLPQPARLRRAKEAKRAHPDVAAAWIKPAKP
jgi:hypothetical protein